MRDSENGGVCAPDGGRRKSGWTARRPFGPPLSHSCGSTIAARPKTLTFHQESLVELRGFEPLTSAVRLRRSPI